MWIGELSSCSFHSRPSEKNKNYKMKRASLVDYLLSLAHHKYDGINVSATVSSVIKYQVI